VTRFIATRLDLSRLQAIKPALILDLDYEAILAARLANLQQRLPSVDVLALESDPAVKLQEADAYRELLDKALLNDTVRGLLPAFANGVDLDHVAARAGIERLELVPATSSAPAVMEDDDTLRMRYFASFGAPAAGSEDGYIFAALTAYPGAHDIAVVGPGVHNVPGRIDVVVLAPGGTATPAGALSDVTNACNGKSTRPLTDMVSVVSATIVEFATSLTVRIRRGPDPAAVRTAVLANLVTILADRYRVGGQVPRSALASAGYDAGAVSVEVAGPVSDIPSDPYSAPWCTSTTVTVVEA